MKMLKTKVVVVVFKNGATLEKAEKCSPIFYIEFYKTIVIGIND